jgi:hypothetical protein
VEDDEFGEEMIPLQSPSSEKCQVQDGAGQASPRPPGSPANIAGSKYQNTAPAPAPAPQFAIADEEYDEDEVQGVDDVEDDVVEDKGRGDDDIAGFESSTSSSASSTAAWGGASGGGGEVCNVCFLDFPKHENWCPYFEENKL